MLGRAVEAFLHFKLTVLAVNLLTFPRLRPARPAAGPRVSLLVPARDEARNLTRTLPLLLAQGAHEVIVLDDHSADGTGDVARALGARVIEGQELPGGWLGKTWACEQLGRAATGDVLIFTDADVDWHDGALAALLRTLTHTRADLLTVWPRQETVGWGERLIVPLNDDVLLSLLPAPLVRTPFAAASAGNGQLMAFRRAAYERLGGHAAVAGEVLEDVRLAARVKARGMRLAVALGGDLLSVRMYGSYAEAVSGFGKSLLSAHGNSRALLWASWAWHVLAYTWPLLARRGDLVLLGLLERLLVNVMTGRARRADALEVLLTPLLPLATLPVYRRAARGAYAWKGRSYARPPRGGRP